jgi:peptidoglycan/xylan/chitin deacetylase (PgdA/CDA1 family)
LKRVLLVLIALSFAAATGTTQVLFEELHLNSASELLFSSVTSVPGMGEYRTLFHADIPGARMEQLSVFPERILLLGDGGRVQVQNRYGIFRMPGTMPGTEDPEETAESPETTAVPFSAVEAFPAFMNGRDIETGKTVAVGASPDGRYLTYLQRTSPGYGDLILHDIESEDRTTISRRVELTLDGAPLRWADDSSFLVYSKGNELYYFSMDHHRSGRSLNERLRRIGPGGITSVRWQSDGSLFYVRGSLVYRIRSAEFFTRSLYQDLLKIGTIVGKLPAPFDPNFDRFWISPAGDKILLSKDGRSVNVLFMQTDDYISTGETLSLPYLYLPRNTRVRTVLWSDEDVVTLLTGSIRHGEQTSNVYRINLRDEESRSRFAPTDDAEVLGVALSPDGSRAIVWNADGVTVREYATWRQLGVVEHPGLIHAVLQGSSRIVLAGAHIIERVGLDDISRGRVDRELLTLSSVDAYGYAPETGSIRAQVGSRVFEWSADGWDELAEGELTVAPAEVASEDYRVYLENLSRGSYRNMVMVRNVETYGTVPLFPRPRREYEPFPDRDEPVDLTNFSHGSRIRQREVSLVFNAIDSVAGLTEILNTLSQYDLRATFFLNGDFIRRHPGAVREIADSGHEVGSLFYTYFDMSSGSFQITSEFVKQGLARNEDEYFEVTGRELSLLWHAPYYFSSPAIIAASREMNYAYIGRDVDSQDWVPLRDENGLSRLYKPSAEIIEDVIAAKRPGSVIAMTVGKPGDDRPDGGRDDYLFQRLDVLINGLIEQGYEIVPVSTLMDNAR